VSHYWITVQVEAPNRPAAEGLAHTMQASAGQGAKIIDIVKKRKSLEEGGPVAAAPAAKAPGDVPANYATAFAVVDPYGSPTVL
jgi:hypothetical protein